MKIGILTYHRTLNYGGCLQALATRLVLEKMGHKVYYVDYWPKYHRSQYAVFSWDKFSKGDIRCKMKYLLNSINYSPYVKIRQKNFQMFLDEYIIPYCKPLTESYDIVIYGSDQIWRKQDKLKDYNPIYFGKNNISAKKHIAFSASMGVLPKSDEDKQKIKQLVSGFDEIAVRENDLKELLQKIGCTNITQTIDPTLLLDASEWNNAIPQSVYNGKKYVLVYALHPEAFNMKYIQDFANKRELQVKVLSGNATHIDTETQITLAGPNEFLRLIKNAEFVFSSSFHGLAFSIIYGKEVFASFSDNSNRAKTLLEIVGISERLLPPGTKVPENYVPIDYEKVGERLNIIRQSSLDYLQSI